MNALHSDQRAADAEPGRGREAEGPTEIPPRGLLDVASRVRRQLRQHNASLLAAGVGLFALLAAFPALGAIVLVYGLFASPADVAEHLRLFAGIMPADALEILRQQLDSLALQQNAALGVRMLLGLAIALWSARKGMAAVMAACNVAYGERERRGFLRQIAVSLAFTCGAIVYFLATLLIGAALPIAVAAVFHNELLLTLLNLVRWLLLWSFIVLALAVIYRYATSRSRAKWRWVSWGSAIAGSLWVAGGVAFEVYVRNLGTYGETYGALGGVVVLSLWLYLSGFVVVLGAEVNAELEHQTARDSTVGPEEPIGQRGAYVADTIGKARPP
jgi:membrane protein